MGFRGRRLDAGGWAGRSIEVWAPGWEDGWGGRRGGLGSEAGGQSGGTVGWDGQTEGWKGWQGRTGKAGKGPAPTGSRPVKGPFGHPPPVSQRAVPSRSRLAGVSPREGRSTPFFSSPFPPLHFLLSSTLRHLNPSGAPPFHPAFRCGEAAGAAIRPPGVESPEPRCGTGFRVRSEGVAAASGAPLPRPPGSRPEPTPGRQTSRERGTGVPEKGKNKEQERVFEQKGP